MRPAPLQDPKTFLYAFLFVYKNTKPWCFNYVRGHTSLSVAKQQARKWNVDGWWWVCDSWEHGARRGLIKRTASTLIVHISTANQGVIIGRRGVAWFMTTGDNCFKGWNNFIEFIGYIPHLLILSSVFRHSFNNVLWIVTSRDVEWEAHEVPATDMKLNNRKISNSTNKYV
jgi:hypothetical protein